MIMVVFIVVTIVLTGLLALVVIRLQRALHMASVPVAAKISPKDMPSVSVCIPARNETHALAECLERVLASDYEKLEMIVFDDSSVDDTSILIRSFAHAGVRFVPGTTLPDGWLGKNYALDILSREASGKYAVFLDVDTDITTTTITQLVRQMTARKLTMLSVIPGRQDVWRASVLFSPLRYFWQLLLSRTSAPASASALWMIEREALLSELGGLVSYKNEVLPEAHLAARLGASYACMVSDDTLGVNYEKKWSSQVETSRRLLFPMAGGNMLGATGALLVLVLLNLPLVAVIAGFPEMRIMGMWLLIAFAGVYGAYTSRTWRRNWWIGALLWPVVVFQELLLFIWSLWGYARHSITWKGRSVTVGASRTDQLIINK